MGDYALSNAAVTGNLAKIRELVERGEGWDVQDALWVAAEKGYLAMVRYLVGECRANVNEKDRIKGRTVLMWSARAGKLEVVRYLVDECGAKVNVKDEFGWTPLMWAAEHGEIEVVRYLAGECGADINVQEAGGHSSLMWAARSCSIPASEVELLDFCENSDIGGEYRAKWLDADAVVKLFILDASKSVFEEEIHLWQRLRHPNVIKMYGACDAGLHVHISSILAFRRRLRSLWASLGESVDVARERESRWEKQRSKQIEIFVSEAEKSYLLLEELQSEEERAAFLIFLKEEMGHPSKYTSGQLGVLQNAYQDIESKVETNDPSELTPEWFIPWYELEIVDKHNPLGRGGFGALRVVEAVQSGEEDLQRCLPWGVLDNDVVKHHVKQKKLPSRPATCDAAQWQLVKRMCVFDPDNRMKISTVVAELARLAEIPPMNQTEISTGTPGGLDAALQVISVAREQLTRLQDNNQEAPNSDGGALRTLYGLLWDRLEQVHSQIHVKVDFESLADFCLLVDKADECTKKLQRATLNLTSLAETTLQCSALSRRLDKFEDAYFLLRENKCFCSTAYAV
ncbi:hypothetical protein KRP22_007800 [Phytophthora ramorum]|nr:Histone-lysine N-methyltransferase EHMT1 [Phytophthora ramorum]